MNPRSRPSENRESAGSSDRDEPVFLAVGRLRRSHGIRGEILMDLLTDFPERLKKGVEVFVGPEHRPLSLRSIRQHSKGLLVAFEGITTPEQAGELRNQLVTVRTSDRPALPQGEYYHHEILGLRAVTEEGELLGVVTEILETGAHDVYIVKTDSGREILLPGSQEVVPEIDLQRGELRVRLLPGLLAED
jgi:16S rRNA processing protein RimM